ncbi:MAG: PAS domain-containing protein [Anaerohalosphaeraceae bacterium]|nr:PAS domain-containing protein [Anaerohalosphaeraceae bacterium]
MSVNDRIELPLLEELEELKQELVQLKQENRHHIEIETELRQTNDKLFTMIENLPGMGYSCNNDRQCTMKFVSKGCYELTGYQPEDFIDNHRVSYNDIIYEDDRKHIWQLVQVAIAKREKYKLLYRIKTAKGDIKWVWEQGTGVFDEDGELLQLQGFIKDIAS